MPEIDVLLLGIFAVAGVSLVAIVGLLVVGAKGGNSAADVSTVPLRDLADTRPTVVSQADLDGILSDSFSQSQRSGDRRKRNRSKASVTMAQRIIRAGIYRKGGMYAFQVTRLVLTVLLTAVGFVVGAVASPLWELAACAAVFGAVAGYILPSFWLDYRLGKRQTRMRRALPDALDLITVCLQGGLSLSGALSRVARELGPAHPMLATELTIVEREIQMGRTTGEALFQMAQRFNLEELRSLSSVVGQTEKYGGTIAGALKNYAESLRIARRQRAEEMAQKAAVKLLFPTILCIFPGIFVVVLGPTAMRMYEVMAGISWNG